jgi:hypothetical protein
MTWRLGPALTIGLGIGLAIGTRLDETGLWVGIVLAVLGVLRSVLDRRSADTDKVVPIPAGDAPGLPGLGTRVEKILRLAQSQADSRVNDAHLEAQRIVSDAQAQAAAILDAARREAGR